jgi:hypothetical protein
MNRHPRFARRTAGSRYAVSRRLAAVAALLFAITVGAAVQAVDPPSYPKYDVANERHTTLRTWRDVNRRCSSYKTVGNRRGWEYSDAGLTPTLRTSCVRGAGDSEPIGSPSAHGG